MKKTFTAILSAAMLLCTAPLSASAEIPYDYPLKYDLNLDRKIDSVDASMVLAEYARVSTNEESQLTQTQIIVADCDNNKKVDAVDASNILKIYAQNSAGDDYPITTIIFSWQLRYGHNVKSLTKDYYTFEEALADANLAKEEIWNWSELQIWTTTFIKTNLPTVLPRLVYVEKPQK